MLSSECIRNKIDKRVCDLTHKNENGDDAPYVCCVCDHLIKRSNVCGMTCELLKKSSSLLSPTDWNAVGNKELEEYYKYPRSRLYGFKPFMRKMLLSPRSSRVIIGNKEFYTCCSSCRTSLQRKRMPLHAIANNNYVGRAPKELLDLNPVELAFLSPTKAYGYCFVWQGGKQVCLKGSLGFYQVEKDRIARGIGQLWSLGAKVVVLLSGRMTFNQKKKAVENSQIRVEKLVAAVKWLEANNKTWEGTSIEEWRKRFAELKPIVIDKSKEEDNSTDPEDANIETTEKFCVYYPDGSFNMYTGGSGGYDDFKRIVMEAGKNGYNLEWQCDLGGGFASDVTSGNTWLFANLLQFPYGRGGFNETRMSNDERTSKFNMQKFIEHLSLISEPDLHRPLHALMLYNLSFRQCMLKGACSVIENGKEASRIIQGLNAQDFANAAAAHESHSHGGTTISRKYLQYVKSVAGRLPHSNEAAGKAQMNMEAMCHNLGPPNAFLTVTFDDDNSFLLQAFSGVRIDDDTPIKDLSDERLRARAKLRTELRLKYPGLSAFIFEEILDIVMEEVVGWNCKTNKTTGKQGLFGNCFACTYAVEEQGRKSLHVHILIWTDKLREEFKKLKSNVVEERRDAARTIANMFDQVGSTKLFDSVKDNRRAYCEIIRATDHKCDVSTRKRKLPVVVGEQQLRNLRHKDGFKSVRGLYAACPHCTVGQFTNEELIEKYLTDGKKVPGLTKYPDTATRRLKTMCLQHQKPDDETEPDATIINAAYNSHLSYHSEPCFRCNKRKKRKTNDGKAISLRPEEYECRMRLPNIPREHTMLEPTDDRKFFAFDGTEHNRPFYTLRPKRLPYDCFQNVSCPAVSLSKLGCGNTNVSFVFPGPILSYTCKYQMKKTQKEDQAEFKNVTEDMRKMLESGRKHETDRSEVLRMVVRSSYKHNSANVVGAPMASFLTRNQDRGRFYHSHSTVWLPLSDMAKTLLGQEPSARINYWNGMRIVEFACRHYLCRPKDIENISFFDFTRKYRIAFVQREKDVTPFINTSYFEHPSFCSKKNIMRQGIKERDEEVPKPLVKVFQGLFPDSAQFGGSIFNNATKESRITNDYAFLVLAMFMPFRSIEDFTDKGQLSYTAKLRQINALGKTLTRKHMAFLQNIQDIKHNYLRYGRPKDELESRTHIYTSIDPAGMDMQDNNDGEDTDPEEFDMDPNVAEFMDKLLEEEASGEKDDSNIPYPDSISFSKMKQRTRCRKESNEITPGVPKRTPHEDHDLHNFVEIQTGNGSTNTANTSAGLNFNEPPPDPTRKDIIKLYIKKQRIKTNLPTCKDKQEEVDLPEANGTAESMNEWAHKAKLDRRQRRAFKNITAQFVLTFYRGADSNKELDRRGRSEFNTERRRLIKLARRRRDSEFVHKQLIMFLHGPGGSGKTALINLVIIYAEKFSELLGYPFTKNTIIISAMSGVAATLLHGRTTHSSCCLYRKPTTDDINAWLETRMLIVDEISFGADEDIENLDKKLRFLKHNFDEPFGGIHIIFAGDFRQLDPVGKDPIHVTGCQRFINWVNCYIELDGMHRYTNDPEWGRLLMRFRNGRVTVQDIMKINERCVTRSTGILPDGIQYASYDNLTRDRINTEIFENYVKSYAEKNSRPPPDAVLIFMDELYRSDAHKIKQPLRSKKTFWENCGESDIFTGRQKPRIDPVLKLFFKCPVMLTHNKNVNSGLANGTCATVEKVLLKHGELPFTVQLEDGNKVKGLLASQVEELRLRHSDSSISPSTFCLQAEGFTFRANWPIPENLRFSPGRAGNDATESIKMYGQQFPCVLNNATTGHKLQGKTVENIFVCNWNYTSNWVYVVLSRVKKTQRTFPATPARRKRRPIQSTGISQENAQEVQNKRSRLPRQP